MFLNFYGHREHARRQTALIEWLHAFKSPDSNYPLLPLSSIVRSTSEARTDKCAASRSNSSRFFGSVAKSRISSHSAASLRSFSNWANMSCIAPPLLLVLPDHQRNGLEQQYAICYEPTLSEITATEYRLLLTTSICSNRTAPTTSDQPIFCDVQQRLNDPATGSIGDNYRASVHIAGLSMKRCRQ